MRKKINPGLGRKNELAREASKARESKHEPRARKDNQANEFKQTPAEVKLNVRPPWDSRQLDPRFEDGEVRVEDVLIRPDHDEVDDGLVTAIAESPSGPFVPIIVRRTPPEGVRTKSSSSVVGSGLRPLAYAE